MLEDPTLLEQSPNFANMTAQSQGKGGKRAKKMTPGASAAAIGGAQLQDQQLQEQIQQFLTMQQSMSQQQNQPPMQQQNQQIPMQQQSQQNNPMQMQMQVSRPGRSGVSDEAGCLTPFLPFCKCHTEPGVVEHAAAASAVVSESDHSTGTADGNQRHVHNAFRKHDAEHGGQLGGECDERGR